MEAKKSILALGAGRSSIYLYEYLGDKAKKQAWDITIADRSIAAAEDMVFNRQMRALELDIQDDLALEQQVKGKDLVISMLPASLHIKVVEQCIANKVNMITASYLSDEIKALDQKAKDAGITILNELGLDPGIDHLSAMEMIDRLKEQGNDILEFESFTGGLVAPESDNNPWGYKFTWNPRNVVIAGQGGAVKFIQNGQYKFIPYHKLFRRTEIIDIEGYGRFEGYANRDSLKYRSTYGLDDVRTMYRGTLRRPGYCKAWNCLIDLGATDDSYSLPEVGKMTHRDFTNTFLSYHPTDSVELKLKQYLRIDQDDVDLWERINYLGLFSDELIGLENATPAQALEHILKKKWSLDPDDKDMIVMWHKLVYSSRTVKEYELNSSVVIKGVDQSHTAMAKTVGLPLAMGACLLLEGKIEKKGTILPITRDIYRPILNELQHHGISFQEIQVR